MTETLELHQLATVATDLGRISDFYVRVLGLWPAPTHSPDSVSFHCGRDSEPYNPILTFFAMTPLRRQTRRGLDGVAFAISDSSLETWRERLTQNNVTITGAAWDFGEEYLCFSDPCGLELALTRDPKLRLNGSLAILGVRSAEIQSDAGELVTVLSAIGFRSVGSSGPITRLAANGSPFVDVLQTPPRSGRPETPGRFQQLVFSLQDQVRFDSLLKRLPDDGLDVTVSEARDEITVRLSERNAPDIIVRLTAYAP